MAVLQKILDVLPLNEEKRRFQRVRVNLLGRYMLADRREFPCQVLDMSPGGMSIIRMAAGWRPGSVRPRYASRSACWINRSRIIRPLR